jgi:hypothetical protein
MAEANLVSPNPSDLARVAVVSEIKGIDNDWSIRYSTNMKRTHYEIRFHLGAGSNYMHWQVKAMCGSEKLDVYYYDPAYYQLEMIKCRLVNKPNKAKKVFEAGVHDVSGWVKCDEVMINNQIGVDNLEKLYYNPIRDPHWRRESDCNEFVWDGSEYATLLTNGKQVYILEERV